MEITLDLLLKGKPTITKEKETYSLGDENAETYEVNENDSGKEIEESFNLQIWLENYLPIIGIAVVVVLIVIKCNYLKG